MAKLKFRERPEKDGMLVSGRTIRRCCRRVNKQVKEGGLAKAQAELAEFEPALARFIDRGCERIAGRVVRGAG